jgi:hypothetical protein
VLTYAKQMQGIMRIAYGTVMLVVIDLIESIKSALLPLSPTVACVGAAGAGRWDHAACVAGGMSRASRNFHTEIATSYSVHTTHTPSLWLLSFVVVVWVPLTGTLA